MLVRLSLLVAAAAAASTPTIDVGRTRLFVCTPEIIRVVHFPTDARPAKVDLMAPSPSCDTAVQFKQTEDATAVTITTASVAAIVSKSTGVVRFATPQAKDTVLAEAATAFNETTDLGKQVYVAEQSFDNPGDDESIYGGGEYQNGIIDYKNAPIQMVQYNTEAVVPFFSSTRGYGLLWDSTAWSFLNPVDGPPLAFTTEEEGSNSNGDNSLADGTPIVLEACDASSFKQQWALSAATQGTLTLAQEASHSKVLDADSGKDVHLWSRDARFDGNQKWTFDAVGGGGHPGLLMNPASKVCLKASAAKAGASVTVSKDCDSADKLMQWSLSPGAAAGKGGFVSLAASNIDPRYAARLGSLTPAGTLPGPANGDTLCLAADDAVPMATASYTATADGVHHFYADACPGGFGCGMGKVLSLSVAGNGGDTILDWNSLTNLPNSLTGRATMKKGQTYTLNYKYSGFKSSSSSSSSNGGGGPPIYVNPPSYGKTRLKSLVADRVDYWFVRALGPGGAEKVESAIDRAIAGYRAITGAAPLYGKWAYGFWQCKEHYKTQDEVLDAARGYRNRSIPMDNIVQDWHYWGNLGWGPQWDPAVYPHPQQMVAELKAEHVQLMVSVWSKFDEKTSFFKDMTASGFMLNGTQYYDAWNAAARERFYGYSKKAMFDIGVEMLWLDATEPEGFPNKDHMTALGSGNALMNSYSLMTTKAIADGLRRDFADAQGARVFSLTRSSFAGQQSTGAALWSGDISGAWDSLRRQVATSINYQMSGIPYWSEDIGGFFRPHDQYTSADYHDMLVRWFQFGAFTPLYRVHGGGSNTEPWNYGPAVEGLVNATHNLRYRLLPYTYSGFHRVEEEGYTMQRGLAFDFADASNRAVRSVADAFMYGDALLVAPVVDSGDNAAKARDVLLPQRGAADSGWVNFWTGDHLPGGGAPYRVAAPLDQSPPLFARAGSLVVMGPFLQHVFEKNADPLEVRVYRGGDAAFTLFEDEGRSRAYQRGAYSRIRFSWTESSKKLALAAREGSGFPGMLQNRTLRVVCVSPGKGTGLGIAGDADVTVMHYSGDAVEAVVC